MFVSVLHDLQQSLILNLAAMDLPVAILAFETTATVALEIVLDSSLAQLAGFRHVEEQGGVYVYPHLQWSLALQALNFLFMFNSC